VFGVLLSLEPAVAATAGWLLLGQRMGPREAVAVGVVVLASAGSTLTSRRPAPGADDDVAGAPVERAAQPT
jgi:inner membrane transporter RhtA